MITRSSFNLYCSTILSGYQISRLLVFENRCSNATVIPATNPRAIRGMLLSGHRGSFSRRPPRSINRGIFIDGTRTRICGRVTCISRPILECHSARRTRRPRSSSSSSTGLSFKPIFSENPGGPLR